MKKVTLAKLFVTALIAGAVTACQAPSSPGGAGDTSSNAVTPIVNYTAIADVAGSGVYGYAGEGVWAQNANLASPNGVAVDSAGNVYLADSSNDIIRKVSASTQSITTIAGMPNNYGYSGDGGPASSAKLNYPQGLCLVGDRWLYVADTYNHAVRKIDLVSGTISTVVGTGVSGTSADGTDAAVATLDTPQAVTVDEFGNLFIGVNHGIQEVVGGKVYKVADLGNQIGTAVCLDLTGNLLYSYTLANGVFKVLPPADRQHTRYTDALVGSVRVAGTNSGIWSDPALETGVSALSAHVGSARGIAVASNGALYFSDTQQVIRRISTAGVIVTLAGQGPSGAGYDSTSLAASKVAAPGGLCVNAAGVVFFADCANQKIRKIY